MNKILKFFGAFIICSIITLLALPIFFGFSGAGTYSQIFSELIRMGINDPVSFFLNPVTAIIALISIAVVLKS